MQPGSLTLDVDPSGKIVKEGTGSGKTTTQIVGLGSLAGFDMALDVIRTQSRGEFKELLPNDRVILECTGIKKAIKAGNSDMIEFRAYVERD